jgi:hypothetical protein
VQTKLLNRAEHQTDYAQRLAAMGPRRFGGRVIDGAEQGRILAAEFSREREKLAGFLDRAPRDEQPDMTRRGLGLLVMSSAALVALRIR